MFTYRPCTQAASLASFSVFFVPGMQPSPSHLLGKGSVTKLGPQASGFGASPAYLPKVKLPQDQVRLIAQASVIFKPSSLCRTRPSHGWAGAQEAMALPLPEELWVANSCWRRDSNGLWAWPLVPCPCFGQTAPERFRDP